MRRGYAALGLLALIWGAAFLFIKLGVRDMSPATLVLSRCVLGALTIGLIFAVRRQTPFPPGTRARLLPFLTIAILGSLFPWVAIAFGETSISSALASILNATTPLWTAIFAYWVTPAERPSGLNYLGVAIGFLGTAILIAPDLIGQPLRASTIGSLAVLGAACSYAVSALFARRRLRGVSPLQVGFWQLTLAAPLTFVVALPTIGATHLTVPSIAAMLFLGVGGSGIAFLLYYFMMNNLCPTRATSVSFLVPVTAVFWGATLLREAITIPIVAGMAVILLGLYLTSRPRTSAGVLAHERPSNNPPPRPSPARGEG